MNKRKKKEMEKITEYKLEKLPLGMPEPSGPASVDPKQLLVTVEPTFQKWRDPTDVDLNCQCFCSNLEYLRTVNDFQTVTLRARPCV